MTDCSSEEPGNIIPGSKDTSKTVWMMPESTSRGSHWPKRGQSEHHWEWLGLIKYIKTHNDYQNVKKKNTNSEQQKSLLITNYLQERGAWAPARTACELHYLVMLVNIPGDPAVLLLGIHPGIIYPKTWMRMSQASFFTRKQHWCLQTVNWISKSRYIHISEHCAKIKKTKGLLLQKIT